MKIKTNMGQRFSANRIKIDIKVIMNKYFPQYPIVKILNNGMLYKTLLVLNDKNKSPLVVKVFLKHDYNDNDRHLHKKEVEIIHLIQKKILLKNNFNICPIVKLIDDYQLGMIFRQYVKFNLKERLFLLPDLSYIEKIWITFQLLIAVNQLVSLNLVHGDLKPENILLTSNLSVYLSDFASYKPAYIVIDEIANYTYYFGSNNSADMGGCYIAPERLVEKGVNKDNNKSYEMDIFSLGVIIAELFLEKNLFDYSSLLNYKKGNKELFNIDEILIKISNEKIRKLIYDMIKINPKERINITDALNYFSNQICPITIKGFIFQFNTMINSTNFWRPDLIVGYLYRYWIPVWKCLYGEKSVPPKLFQHINLEIANKIILEDPFNQTNVSNNEFIYFDKEKLSIEGFVLNFYPQKRTLLPELMENKNIFIDKNNRDCVIIIANYLLDAMQYCKFDSSILLAMEMVMNLSNSLDDIIKLKIIIPYYINFLKRKNFLIKIVALDYAFKIFYSINYIDLILPVTEYNYFHIYVLPFLLDFCQNSELILDFFENLEKIIELEKNFLNVTLKSRIKKAQEIIKNEQKVKGGDGGEKNSQKKDNKKNLLSDIFKDYDNSLEEFKTGIFKILTGVIGGKNEIDLLIVVIRKLPILLELFGQDKVKDFNIFIVNNFNKTNWILQKEIFLQIPKMIKILGKDNLINFILPCIDSLLTNNSNEGKMIELIKDIDCFLDMGYLTGREAAEFFAKMASYLLHPNVNIRSLLIKLLYHII